MRALCALAFAALAAAACSPPASKAPETASVEKAAPPSTTEFTLSADGFDPVRVGMTLDEASAALGAPIVAGNVSDDPNACDIARSAAHPGLSFLTQGGRIDRASVYAPSPDDGEDASDITTDKGIGLGGGDADIRAAYPNAVEQPAKYNGPPAHDMIVWTTPNERGVRFEIDEAGKVWAIHAGGPTILYVEGCS